MASLRLHSSLSSSSHSFPLSNSTLLFIPNTVMHWSMNYANRVSRRKREEYLRSLADVEANITSHGEDSLRRALLAVDDSDDEEIERVEGRELAKGKKEVVASTIEDGGEREEREVIDAQQSKLIVVPTQRCSGSNLVENSKINGIGLPVPTRGSYSEDQEKVEDEKGTQKAILPPTMAELNVLEAPGQIPPAHASNSFVKVSVVQGGVWHDGWPPYEKKTKKLDSPPAFDILCGDLPPSVKQPWETAIVRLSVDDKTHKSSSIHSSANDKPPPSVLVSKEQPQIDPGVLVINNYQPLLMHLLSFFETLTALHRHICTQPPFNRRGISFSSVPLPLPQPVPEHKPPHATTSPNPSADRPHSHTSSQTPRLPETHFHDLSHPHNPDHSASPAKLSRAEIHRKTIQRRRCRSLIREVMSTYRTTRNLMTSTAQLLQRTTAFLDDVEESGIEIDALEKRDRTQRYGCEGDGSVGNGEGGGEGEGRSVRVKGRDDDGREDGGGETEKEGENVGDGKGKANGEMAEHLNGVDEGVLRDEGVAHVRLTDRWLDSA